MVLTLMTLMLLGDDLRPAVGDIEAIRTAKRATAVRIAEPIRLDGVLDEPVWKTADPAAEFYQQQPSEFEPATRRVEVRFLYDATTLYIGAMLYDEAPERLIVNDLKRDFAGLDSDMFGVILDTFLDGRTAYGFLTNPGGAQRETQSYDNGRRTDANWHGVWLVQTAIRPDGWTAEMAIPFRTLRFPQRSAQEWGLNLVRVLRRENERATWSPVPRQFSHYNVAYAGVLAGISGVERGRGVQVKPFATAGLLETAVADSDWTAEGDGGVDVKWGLSSALSLDATYRTDFSQVEADEQQINLTRFSLFFPEKREFFLESPASFQIGIVEPDTQQPRRDLLPFFSRRIGLSADGQPVPVLGGLRLTGRAGRQGIGVLTMQTRAGAAGERGANFTAVRVTRDVASRVTLGGFYFGRESSIGPEAFNRVAGFDVRVAPTRTFQGEAYAMRSVTEGGPGDWAGQVGLLLDSRGHRVRAGVVHVGPSFQHDLGFVRRPGSATSFLKYTRLWRPAGVGWTILEHRFGFEGELVADDGYRQVLTQVGTASYGMLFADGAELKAWGTTTVEQLGIPFKVGPFAVRAGEYRFDEAGVTYQSNKSAAVSGSFDARAGEFWSGRQRAFNAGVRLRVNAHFAAQASLGTSHLELPEGSYSPSLLGLRLDYSFSPRMFLNAFVQHNSAEDAWLSNVRFNLIHRPLSDIYLVWNETRLAGITRRALLLKYTHLMAF